MKKSVNNLLLMYMLFGVCLVTANCVGSKVFDTGLNLFGSDVTLTTGVWAYPITFLITDIIGEIWGKKEARWAVICGFIVQIVSSVLIIIAKVCPAVDMDVQSAFVTILGQQWVFVIASLVGYFCSQNVDVLIFHGLRDRYIKKHGSTKGGKWIWNNASTCTSQLVDSILYAGIAFGLGFGWIWNNPIGLVNMILAQWLIKVAIAFCDTPIFYFCTRGYNGTEKS